MGDAMEHLSDVSVALPEDPADAALRGPHRDLALGGDGPAWRYPPEVSPFGTLGLEPDVDAWAALAALPGEFVALFHRPALSPTAGWTLMREIRVLQLAWAGAIALSPGEDPAFGLGSGPEPLGEADVPAMLELTAQTQPGPFLSQTIAFGGYLGIRRDGALAAMAGRRLHPEGWIEVSAVCTDPAHRGAGLARRVSAAVVDGILAEGARPFLHVLPTNPAVRLYEAMGFARVRETSILVAVRS
jgi:ribosomal protein S18 acetylase RimI-like enzyme